MAIDEGATRSSDDLVREWGLGTVASRPAESEGRRETEIDLLVKLTEAQYESLLEAVSVVRQRSRGVLYRVVFDNREALERLHDDVSVAFREQESRNIDWGEVQTRVQVAFANWLGSVRWLLDHTRARFGSDEARLKRFKEATAREFDAYPAYRLTYKLRDYATHRDLPPIAVHASSRLIDADGREDQLAMQLLPGELLTHWNGWGGRVSRDLRERPEPIELIPFVNDAMESIERVMLAIIREDLPTHYLAAVAVLDADMRIPKTDPDVHPTAFEIGRRGERITQLTPTPLPVAVAREIVDAGNVSYS